MLRTYNNKKKCTNFNSFLNTNKLCKKSSKSEKNIIKSENNIENTPFGNSIKVGNIENAQNNFTNKMNWLVIKSDCEKLGAVRSIITKE